MAIRYSSDALLKLRESPLVAKPTSLPPAEEWMGQPADPSQKRTNSSNARSDAQSKTYPKMGNGGIILGPPKASFSSTFKGGNTPFDSPNRSTFGNFGSDAPRADYFSKNKQNEREGGGTPDERASGQRSYGRRGDSNSWSVGFDDDEKPYRRGAGRDGEFDGKEGKEGRRQRGYDNIRKDNTRDTEDTRRNGGGRANRPSWLRDDEPTEARSREGTRSGDWRDNDRGTRRLQDRDWNRGAPRETEPEWMASDSLDEKAGRSTQDIEQWKASMKAKERGATPVESMDSSNSHSRTTSNTVNPKPKGETPLMLDSSADDKFFGLMNAPSAPAIGRKLDGSATAGKGAKASKFSGFFGPQTPASSADNLAPPHPPPQAAPPDGASDDKAGFQRILAMLAGPQGSTTQPSQNAPPGNRSTPPAENATLHPSHSPPPIISPRSRRPGALENLLGMQSPPEAHTQPSHPTTQQQHQHNQQPAPPHASSKDADFLLNLLRSRDNEGQQPHGMPPGHMSQPYHGGPPPGSSDGQRGNGMFDDFSGPRHGLNEGPPNQQHRTHPQQHPYEDHDDHHERGAAYPPHFHMGPGGPPPGLQRPPGFENMPPPPGFPQYMQPPRQGGGGGMPGPPPGFAGRFPPGLIPNMAGMNLGGGNEPPRGAGGAGGLPPPHLYGGMRGPPPPPGFMGMNGPPPGFPPMGASGPPGPHGPPPDGYPGGPSGPPLPPSRMMEMFSEQFAVRDGPPPPGSYRRE